MSLRSKHARKETAQKGKIAQTQDVQVQFFLPEKPLFLEKKKKDLNTNFMRLDVTASVKKLKMPSHI